MRRLADLLADALSVYGIPDDELVDEVLIPAMAATEEMRIGAGFVSHHGLAQNSGRPVT